MKERRGAREIRSQVLGVWVGQNCESHQTKDCRTTSRELTLTVSGKCPDCLCPEEGRLQFTCLPDHMV
jgi:hypothetical protein